MNKDLINFIEREKEIFLKSTNGIKWDDTVWKVNEWLFHRGVERKLNFNSIKRFNSSLTGYIKTDGSPLPLPYRDFAKATVCYLKRTKKLGFAAVIAYLNELKRLYLILHQRNEDSPEFLTRWHIEMTIDYLKQISYKNLYDSSSNFQVISEVIDRYSISKVRINYKTNFKPNNQYYKIKEIDVNHRGNDKIPSYEALKAYAKCTNSPLDNNEEILLRVIDLLIATGMRGNEVCYIPLDCWVERNITNEKGMQIKDVHGNELKDIGIRYYAEKKFSDRVHWLAPQDIPIVKRAVERLKILTKEAREISIWQENNPGRIWNIPPEKIITDQEIKSYLGFNRMIYLQGYLKRKDVKHHGSDYSYSEPRSTGSSQIFYSKKYKAGDIEKVLLESKLADKNVLIKSEKTILKTSQLLAIRFDGAFRFKRNSNTFKVYPGKINLKEINNALGVIDSYESIFERRNLTEADGSKIRLTSHQPRHWRNTLYELAGMSNVQQALALGRQNLTQNKAYQHTTYKERTKLHQEFISFNSVNEKVHFLHEGIRNKSILGEITNTYHKLKKETGLNQAEDFLKTHGLAIHLTPFGGCTHDFSQSPCLKHLQCWNGCSHLHRTNTPGETERIKEQLKSSEEALAKMKKDLGDNAKNSKWIFDLKKKVENLKKASVLKLGEAKQLQLFPDGIEITTPNYKKRNSSV